MSRTVEQLVNKNWVPYLLLALGIGYYLFDSNQQLQARNKILSETNEKLKKKTNEVYQAMAAIQTVNQEQFEDLRKMRSQTWKEGKGSAKF